MPAVILAAGEGSRLRPLTASKPKPMIRVANKPILQYCVEALAANGVQDITFVLGYHREKVQSYFEDGRKFGVRISYVFQDALLGTAHALSQVKALDADTLVLGGDNIVDAELVQDVLKAPPGIVLAAKAAENPSKYGVLTLEGDRVRRIQEQPPDATSEFVNTGVYRFTPQFLDHLRKQVAEGVMGITQALQRAIEGREVVRAVRSKGLWMDAIYPWDLLALNSRLVRDAKRADGSAVHERALVEGPHAFGHDVEVGPNSVVQPTTTIGNNVLIGPGCIIENSVLSDDVQIGPGAIIRNSVIGEGTRVGARFTSLSGPADVRVRDGWHRLADFGTVIGEDCTIEGGVTIGPGVLIGNRVSVSAGSFVSRNADDGAVVLG